LGQLWNDSFDSAFKYAALKKDTVLAFQAFNAYIRTKSDYLPFIAAAGMLLLEANHITELYLHNHLFISKS